MLTKQELKEMELLSKDKAVKAARKEIRDKYKEKQKLYTLRYLKKKGEALLNNS